MRNPWPMFCVLVLTGLFCAALSAHTIWIGLILLVVLILAWLVVPMKYDDWLAKKINPYLLEYQQEHDLKRLENGLNQWRPWAITRTSQNMMQVNWFCALLEQERWEDAEQALEQIKMWAKTTVDWMNYYLLQVQYATKIGDQALAEEAQQLSIRMKGKVERKQSNGLEKATAKQCRQAFFCWLFFGLFLLFGGGVITYLAQGSGYTNVGVGAVILSFFAFPISVVWLIVWLVRTKREEEAKSAL